MALGQRVCLSPDSTVEQAKLSAGSTIFVATLGKASGKQRDKGEVKVEQFKVAPTPASAATVPRLSHSLSPTDPAATPADSITELGEEDKRLKVLRRAPATATSPAALATAAPAPSTPAAATTPAALAAAAPSVAWSCCWRCSSCWSAYRRAVNFSTFLMLLARSPRLVTLWKAQLISFESTRPAIVAKMGASRQEEKDCFASMLVQVLGVKESGDLKEGFGFSVQHLLSGGLEKEHAEGRRGAGGKATEKAQRKGKGRGSAEEKGVEKAQGKGKGRGRAEEKGAEKTHGKGKGLWQASHGKEDGRHGEDEAEGKAGVNGVADKCWGVRKNLSWKDKL
ncbi:unnamed protein product [Closterium sp. NIES-54]